jgi:hypothetical protein
VCLHPSTSLNNEKICCEISEDKIAVCEKTAGLRCGKFSDLNSACSKVLVPVKIFQFQDILNENRFLGTFRGHSKRPIRELHRNYEAVLLKLHLSYTKLLLVRYNRIYKNYKRNFHRINNPSTLVKCPRNPDIYR